MPIYEYECKACGRRFEAIQKVGDRKKPSCPGCRSAKVGRLISRAGFVLKGSGWYNTDYPSEARKKGLESDKKDQGGGAPDPGKKGKEKEPKPEAKKEKKSSGDD